MQKLFLSEDCKNGNQILLNPEDSNHVRNVLRMRIGDPVFVSDRENLVYECKIADFREKTVVLEILSSQSFSHELPVDFVLFQGFPKGDKFELILQKAVELGVKEIVPVYMKRTIVKLDDKKEKSRVSRYSEISKAAAEQSNRDEIPQVHSFVNFEDALELAKTCDLILAAYENRNGMDSLKKVGSQIRSYPKIGLFIGPEGGFEESEIEELKKYGAEVISLGKRILRTETAGLALLSYLMLTLETEEE